MESRQFTVNALRDRDRHLLTHVIQTVDRINEEFSVNTEYRSLISQYSNTSPAYPRGDILLRIHILVSHLFTDDCVKEHFKFLVWVLCDSNVQGEYNLRDCRFELSLFGELHVFLTHEVGIEIPGFTGREVTRIRYLSFHFNEEGSLVGRVYVDIKDEE